MKKLITLILCLSIFIAGQAQVSKTVNVTTAGKLSAAFTATEKTTVTNLTITGTIDARDFKFMRDTLVVLSVLDISGVTIPTYTGTGGTSSTSSTTYPANELPIASFCNPITENGKTTLVAIVLPTSITSIGNSSFAFCYGLTNVLVPNSVTLIGSSAFLFCSNLTGSLTIPNSVKLIGSCAFEGCNKLTEFIVQNANRNYFSTNGVLFNKNQDTLIAYPAGRQGRYTIPNTVKFISFVAFMNASKLSNLTIPNSVTGIEAIAFSGCSGLTSLHADITNPIYLNGGINTFGGVNKSTCILYVPKGSKTKYQAAEQWKDFTNIVEFDTIFNVNRIQYLITSDTTVAVTRGGTYTGDISIPSSVNYSGIIFTVKSIDKYAFFNCAGLTSFTLPSSVTSIGNNAFKNCSNITSVAIPDKITTVGSAAFSGCNGLTSISLGNSTTSVADSTYYNCTSLRSITLPSSIRAIGSFAFYGCNRLKGTLTIPSAVTSIGSNTFASCDSITTINYNATNCTSTSTFFSLPLLQNVVIGESVSTIPTQAFTGCTGISSLTFNASNCTSLGKNYTSTFANKPHLKNINIGDKVTIIPADAFRNCDSITSVVIPDKVAFIGSAAFIGCDGLTYVSLGNGVTSVADSAFSKCTKLANVTFGTSVSSLGAASFGTCQKIRRITCLGDVPADCNSNSFGISDYERSIIYGLAKLYVPSTSSAVYSMVAVWKEFANRFTVGTSTDGVTITPADNTAVISWSQNTEASSYKMIIYGDVNRTVRICTLSFNATGQLTSIAFVRSVSATKETQYSFTVSGLNSGTTYQYTMTGYNSTNDVVSVQQGTFTTTGVSALSNTAVHNLIIYPNPAIDAIHITGISNIANLQLLDLNGRVTMSKQVSNDEAVSVSSLPQGMYIVKLKTTEGTFETKLIKN